MGNNIDKGICPIYIIFCTFYKSDDKIMMQGPICSGSLDDFIKIVIEEGNTPKYLPMINYVKSYFGEE